jgi:hypothetical protein
MGWADLIRDRDRQQTFVTAVMNLLVPRNAGIFLIV